MSRTSLPLCTTFVRPLTRLASSSVLVALAVTALPACAAASETTRYDMQPQAEWAPSEAAPAARLRGGAAGGSPGTALFSMELAEGGGEGDAYAPQPAKKTADAPSADTAAEAGVPDAAERRLVIYSATLHVVVNETDRARRRFLNLVSARGGHLQQSDRAALTVRVPSAVFQEVLDEARKLGRVADEQVQARDVTRQVFELSLRIDNAEHARLRLIELLERGGKLEHVLRLEQELRRVTEEIELLKGKRRQLEGEAAFSTLVLRLSSHAPAPTPLAQRKVSPFPWVRDLGPERVLGMSLQPDALPDLLPAPFEMPGRFVSVEEGPYEIRAVSAEGAKVWMRTRFVADADLSFWETALLEELDKVRGYDVVRTERHTLPGERELLEIVAETTLSAIPHRYQLLVEVGSTPLLGTWVQTLEHVGEADGFDDAALDLRASAGVPAEKVSQSALAQEAD